jgi:hypothetical protein
VASLFAQSTQPVTEAFTLINSDYSSRNRARKPEAEEETLVFAPSGMDTSTLLA